MEFLKKIISRLSLQLKFAIWTFMLMLIGMSTVFCLFVVRERESAIDSIKNQLWSIIVPLAINSRYKIVEKDISALRKNVKEIGQIRNALYAAFYDAEGNCIYHSDFQADSDFQAGGQSMFRYKRSNPTSASIQYYGKIYEASAPIVEDSKNVGFVVVGFSTEPIHEQTERAYLDIVTFGPPIVFAGMVLSALLARTISRPIHHLTEKMKRISADELGGQIEVRGKNEIETLTQSFDQMTRSLRSANKKIEDYNKMLEGMVEERTRQLKETRDKLVQSERLAAIGQFAAAVAHSIRNPLSGIRATAQLIAGELTDDNQMKKDLGEILNEVDKLDGRLKGLLNLSYPSRLQLAGADVNYLVEEVISSFTQQINKKNLSVRKSLGENLPRIPLDLSQMENALSNLISNAIEALPREGKLDISTSLKGKGANSCLEIVITDNGSGISKKDLKKVCDPFFTTKVYGTGLGLPISLKIIEAHGGLLKINSRGVGKGVTTVVMFPIKKMETTNRG